MSITSFIPKVWSAKILEALHRNLILGALCGHDYEEDVAEYGDTVHIGTLVDATIRPYNRGATLASAEALSGTDQALTVDHCVYAHVKINDIDAAQARADLLAATTRMIGRRFAEDTETFLMGIVADGAGITGSIDASGDLANQVIAIMTAMDGHNVPRPGRFLLVPPTFEGALLKNSTFQALAVPATPEGAAIGATYFFAGFDICPDIDLSDNVVGVSRGALQLVQTVRTEIYRPESDLATGIKAYSLCGAKVTLPDAIAFYEIS